MHVTIRRYSGSPELADALVAREGEVRDIITGIGGFQAYYLIRDADGEATSITANDSESGAEESNRAGRRSGSEKTSPICLSARQRSLQARQCSRFE
jgi:hypothetical protein